MRHDLIFALRLFRRQPLLVALTVAGLAVAIGISGAMFGVVRAVEFGDYGIRQPESVYRIALPDGPISRTSSGFLTFGNWAAADFKRLQESTKAVSPVAAVREFSDFRFDDVGPRLPVTALAVSGNYCSVLGLRAIVGRVLTADDDVPGVAHVMVSEGFWKSKLGGDPAILGRNIWIGDRPYAVVGVADRAHSGPPSDGFPPAFWITLAAHADMRGSTSAAALETTRGRLAEFKKNSNLGAADRQLVHEIEEDLAQPAAAWNPPAVVFGRLAPGFTAAQAESEITGIARALASQSDRRDTTRPPTVQFTPVNEHPYRRTSIAAATILSAIVAIVVLLACANVTNLLLAGAAARRREIGTRLAIGAGRWRVIRQLVIESLVLGMLGGGLGLAMATAMLPAFAALGRVPPAIDTSPDLVMTVFAAGLAISVGVIAGLAPARYGARADVMAILTADQHAAPRPLPKGFLRMALIGGQAATSIVLMVLAALLTRSLLETAHLDVGYDVTKIMSVSVSTSTNGRSWSAARTDAFWVAALERVRQLPGVEGASLALPPPFSGISAPVRWNGRQFVRMDIGGDYFATLGVPLLRGRTFTTDEMRNAAPVAIISARVAAEFWSNDDPLGSSLERVWGREDERSTRLSGTLRRPLGTRIVGVVSDAATTLGLHDAGAIYLPLAAASHPRMVVRTTGDPRALTRSVRAALETVDPTVSVRSTIASDELGRDREAPRMLAALAAVVGGAALWLAMIGLFGVTSFAVQQRTHEMSVRRALGATDGALIGLLLRDNLKPVAAGLLCGLVLAFSGGRVIESLLIGVSSRDPVAVVGASVLLLAATLAAVYLPARRAARANPAELLKLG